MLMMITLKVSIPMHKMSNNIFPEITFRDGRWFLRYISDGELIREIELPDYPMMNRIWEASQYLLDVYIDDCGANLDRCIEVLSSASIAFAGISQLLSDQADKEQEQLDLDRLYAPSDDEPWYNR